ncbi:MAG TPA: [protein-PII] uridylyltransferase [Micromonosporaceae bacterium]|nr:[protein-PII] uridylyltransferase [Micromonosporaceae bacterium]
MRVAEGLAKTEGGRLSAGPLATASFGVGDVARAQRSAALDGWLGELFATAVEPGDAGASEGPAAAPDQSRPSTVVGCGFGCGLALIAVGGLGRRECAPSGDVDLLLVYEGEARGAGRGEPRPVAESVAAVAERIWYPIWDSGLTLDHSVRSYPEVLAVTAEDTKAALGLLDARHIAGDAQLTAKLRQATLLQWRQRARAHLPVLRDLATRRWRAQGELAFLLDGDIKEARGGLRDVRVLRGVAFAQVADSWRPPVRAAYTRLLDVRDCLHIVAGRRRDRLFAQDLDEVAALLGLPGPDALRRRVADDARAIAYAVDDSLRAADRWLAAQRRGGRQRGRVVRTPVAPDVVAQDGEVVLARAAVTPDVDPTLSLRVAAAAALNGLRISPGTLEWLALRCPPLPRPWPPAARTAFAQLLGTGPALVSTWEACDRYGLVTTWLPEWARIRSAPQHNPVHRFTVDRHLIETVAVAARYAREVARPDLLFLGALLHDIGKGLPGDHAAAGVEVAASLTAAMGISTSDAEVIGRLVRQHLLLPEVATRRDLDDPQTIRHVAEAVRDEETLDLLHALCRADAVATGPGAWSAWKERLVADLVARTRSALRTGTPTAAATGDRPVDRFAPVLAAGALPAVEIYPDRVTVAARDRLGLLASVAGCLTLHRLDVVSADTATLDVVSADTATLDVASDDTATLDVASDDNATLDVASDDNATIDGDGGPVAVVACRVQPRDAAGPDRRRLAHDLHRAVTGELSVDEALAARARSTVRLGGTGREAAPPRVVWAVDQATDATILELRAADDVGLLYRVAHALEEAGANVRAARISTLGPDVVDAFYLVGDWSDRSARDRVEKAVLAAATPATA